MKNFSFDINLETAGTVMKLLENKLMFKLEEMEDISEKLTIENLSILFPDMARKYKNDMKKLLRLHLKFDLPDKPLI